MTNIPLKYHLISLIGLAKIRGLTTYCSQELGSWYLGALRRGEVQNDTLGV